MTGLEEQRQVGLAAAPGPATHLIAVRHRGSELALAGDAYAVVVHGMHGCFRASSTVMGGLGLVLGLDSNKGLTSRMDCVLGQVACMRYLALTRSTLWWMWPLASTSLADLPPETQFLLLELSAGGPYALLLPLIDGGRFRAQLLPLRQSHGSPQPQLGLRVESGTEATQADSWRSVLLVAAGGDPYELIDSAVVAAAGLSGGARPRWEKEMPPSLNYFGWCTWDAFYTRVSPEGIAQGLHSLAKGGCSPKFVIIDDGWQMSRCDPEYGAGRDGATYLTASHLDAPEAVGRAASSKGTRLLMSQSLDIVAANDLRCLDFVMATMEEDMREGSAAEEQGWQPTEAPRRLGLLTSVLLSALAFAQGLYSWLAATLLALIKTMLQESPHDSWRIRVFAALAQGPLRRVFLRFYASASHHTQRLCGIPANSKFASLASGPDGPRWVHSDLDSVVRGIKAQFGVSFVYCWHALGGYWGGVAPDPSMQKYRPRVLYPRPNPTLLEVDPWFAWNQFVLAGSGIVEDPQQLHSDMHAYLKGCGVDGVKVDVQSQIGLCGSALQGGPLLSAAYHASLERSVREHFPGNHAINCMCHCTEDIYRMDGTAIARCSDDFYPRLSPSWLPHIAICAYNTLMLGALVQPDFDMFQSKHPVAALHAAARAVSGGPVYVSDRPQQHDFGLLRRLVLPDGSILRAQLPGRPTRDCLLEDTNRDGRSVLKIWNLNDVTGVVGAFNLQGSAWDRWKRRFTVHAPNPPMLLTKVRPSDVDAFRRGSATAAAHAVQYGPAQRFVLYSDSSKRLAVVREGGALRVSLAAGGWDLVTVSPLMEACGVGVAPIGLVGMMNAGGAIKSFALHSTARTHSLGRVPSGLSGSSTNGSAAAGGDEGAPASPRSRGSEPLFFPAAEDWSEEGSNTSSFLGMLTAVADATAALLVQVGQA